MKPFFALVLLAGALPIATTAQENPDTPPENPAIRLQSTFIGDKEQPAVSYFVPWQGTSTPDKLQWSMENKHDATLEAVDRKVLHRTVTIYQEMQLEGEQ
ncbi:hypothetical protein [Marinimicrobium agarilyticum]|uniref:hypothetical protein n=1 Tax=Marinimicrobium agarilyticum TaxID=306546 RepID=UPI0003FE3CED|nr:hypothetical protein [Marinimicrobium agarilyticum]